MLTLPLSHEYTYTPLNRVMLAVHIAELILHLELAQLSRLSIYTPRAESGVKPPLSDNHQHFNLYFSPTIAIHCVSSITSPIDHVPPPSRPSNNVFHLLLNASRKGNLYRTQLCVSPPPIHSFTHAINLLNNLYSDHVKELNNTKPKQPFFFLKPTSSILLPGAGPVIRPRGVDMHFEVELALIMGKELKDFDGKDEDAAIDAIDSTFTPLLHHHDRISTSQSKR